MRLFSVLMKKELVTQLFGDARGKKRDIPGAIVSVLISALFLTIFVYLFVQFQGEFYRLSLENEVLVLFIAVALTVQIIFMIARAGKVLYGGADAKVVLPLPISNVTMLAAKLAALWIKETVNSVFFLVPILLAYGIMTSSGPLYYIGAVFVIIIASLFTVSVAAIISPLYIKVKKFIAKYPLPILAVSLAFFVAVFMLYSRLLNVISDMLIGNRLRFLFNTEVAAGIRQTVKFLVYSKQIADMLLGNVWCVIIVVAVTAAVAAGAYFVSSKCYLSFLKSSAAKKTRPAKERPNAVRGKISALIRKDLTEIFFDPALLFSYLSVVLTLPLLCYVTLGAMDGLVENLLGNDFRMPFAILIIIMFSCVCNTSAGDVISREENRIMIVKTIPVSYRTQVWVKAGIALAIAGISDALTILILVLSGMVSNGQGAILLFIALFSTFASVLSLISADVNNPSIGKGDENVNVTVAIVRALLISCVLGGFCFIISAVGTLYSGGNATFGKVVNFYNGVGGGTGLSLICLAVCALDFALSAVRLSVGLDGRMRRIKI